MALEDRDYMRERAQERVAQPRRRRQRTSGLEALLTAPFRSQSAAILIGLVGLILASPLPSSIIMSMATQGLATPTNPQDMMMQATSRGMLGGIISLTPALRLLGLVMLATSGIALIKQRRKWGYSTVLKDPSMAACLGGLAIAIVTWSLAAQGLWRTTSQKASRDVVALTSGIMPPVKEVKPIREPGFANPSNQPQVRTYTDVGPPPPIPAPGTLTPGLPQPELERDRPFPNNGTFERAIPLQGKIASLTFVNRSSNNAIVVWYYNMNDGKGDQEALKLYLTAGQSAAVDIPAYDYRMAVYEAAPGYGLDRGFGPAARPKDLGLIDLKTPATALIQQPTATYSGYGIFTIRPGILARR